LSEDYVIGPDIDLDTEEVYMPDGSRLTEARAEEIAEDTLRTLRGRPSLSGRADHSPRVSFRLAPAERDRAEELAAREGKTLSAMARDALEEHIDRAG
jgi:hypothetical protein